MAGEGRKWPLILGIVAGLLLLAGICCCGGGFLGMRVFKESMRATLEANPVVAERIGQIEDLDFDIFATGADPDPDVMVFRVRGSRGSGVVTAEVETDAGNRQEVVGGSLRMSSGELFELVPADESGPEDEEDR